MKGTSREQLLALAAALQAISLVSDIARHGRIDSVLVRSCLQGLIRPYQGNISALYGGAAQLRPGLIALRAQLTDARDPDLTRYAIVLLHLEKRLQRQPDRLQGIANGLDRARRQAEYFDDSCSGPVVAALAHLYAEHVSTMRPRIMVSGEREHLQQIQNADLIRALLLSALRAISFWRQHGGSRVALLLRRKAMLHMLDAMLKQA